MSNDIVTLPIREVVAATPRSRIVRLDLTGVPFQFRAGQAVMVGARGQTRRRPYSIACAPEEAARDGRLELLIQVTPRAGAGPHLRRLRAGTRVDVAGPMGSFQFPAAPAERRFLFIAGGTGIAPLRAMLWHLLLGGFRARARYIGLLYSARAPEEFAYARELEALARRGDIDLKRTITRSTDDGWAGERGRIGREHLAGMVSSPATLCFICGPPELLRAMRPLLGGLGVPGRRILVEEWAD